jgi:ribosomal protein S27E
MQTVSCPSCGAPLAFKSHASVMAVCEFCRATVVKDAGAVHGLGRMSEVLEDYSPIQIGTAGVAGGRQFTVIGRIQLRYASGLWNEWFVLFGDGATGWLGDSSGRYTLTTEQALGASWPAFDAIRPGHDVVLEAGRFVAAEKRAARCVGGQGELPFRVGERWEARVADLRQGRAFATLDYSDADANGGRPVLYTGTAVTLEQLECQLLRDDDAVKASAARYRGKVSSLLCPNCGTSINYLPGVTPHVVCQTCHTALDAATPAVQVLKAGDDGERHRFTIPLGSTGHMGGREVRVLGAMRRADNEGNRWSEYLLYNPRAGFSWLVETDDGWWRAEVMDEWPTAANTSAARLDGVSYTHLVDYTARVELALGAFNWKVTAGDTVRVAEYQHGQSRLAAESNAEEFTWSRSSRVAADQVRAWFGLSRQAVPAPILTVAERASMGAQSRKFLFWLCCLNLVPLILSFRAAAPWLFLGIFCIALPPMFLKNE